MKILVSGFEPFGEFLENPTERLAKDLGEQSLGFPLKAIVLPVSYERAFTLLKEEIDSFQPDYVVAFGLAGNRKVITPERIAINCMKSTLADNDGCQEAGNPVIVEGEDGIFTSLPLDELIEACSNISIPCEISNTAGTYVCNALMYQILFYGREKGFRGGFIHIPPISEALDDGLSYEQIFAGAKAMLAVIGTKE